MLMLSQLAQQSGHICLKRGEYGEMGGKRKFRLNIPRTVQVNRQNSHVMRRNCTFGLEGRGRTTRVEASDRTKPPLKHRMRRPGQRRAPHPVLMTQHKAADWSICPSYSFGFGSLLLCCLEKVCLSPHLCDSAFLRSKIWLQVCRRSGVVLENMSNHRR